MNDQRPHVTHTGQRVADQGDGTFLNPVIAGDYPDPSVIRDGEEYLLVASSFVYYPGLVVWRSTDLVNWSPVGPALEEPLGSVYAPDLVKHDGRFFIYFAVRGLPGFGDLPDGSPRKPLTTYVVHADNIAGPWSSPIDLGIDDQIDPGHAVGEDGRRYLYVSEGHLVPLSDDGLARLGPAEKLYDGWTYPSDWEVETFALEGPKVVRHGDWFYLFSAEGGTAGPPTSHMVVVARSRSIRGPWENSPNNPLVRTRTADERWWSRGHATPVQDADGRWWLVQHGYENGYRTLGRQTIIEPFDWPEGQWPRALGGDISRPMSKPSGRGDVPSVDASCDLASATLLGARLSIFKPKASYRRRFETCAGGLKLEALAGTIADSSPLVFNASDPDYSVSIELDLQGGAVSGLLLFYNEKLFCGLAADGREVSAYTLGREDTHGGRAPLIGQHVHLKMINRGQVASFFSSADGIDWTRHRSYEVSGYNHNIAGGFLSLRPSVFAIGEGHAVLRSFQYAAL